MKIEQIIQDVRTFLESDGYKNFDLKLKKDLVTLRIIKSYLLFPLINNFIYSCTYIRLSLL